MPICAIHELSIACHDKVNKCKYYKLYKQLKAKEQELKELQETIDDFIIDNNSLYSDDGKQPSNLDELQECMQSSMNEFVKYKQTLAEIKEICNSVENIENINSLYDAKLSGMFLQAKKILQKISKCEI